MSVYLSTKTDILAVLSAAAGVTLVDADLTLGPVTPTVVGDNTPANSKMIVWISPSNASYKGGRQVFFDRLNLADCSKIPQWPQDTFPVGTSVYSMFASLKSSLGINFDTSDLVETFVTVDTGVYSVMLQAKSDSLGWIGQYKFILPTPPQLSTAFNNNILQWS